MTKFIYKRIVYNSASRLGYSIWLGKISRFRNYVNKTEQFWKDI